MAKQPESALYVISANGGNPQRRPSGDAPVLNASWSPDGGTLVIGEWVATQAPVLRMLNLRSKQLYVLPGSEGLFSSGLVAGWQLHCRCKRAGTEGNGRAV